MITTKQYARLKELVSGNSRNFIGSNDRTDIETAYRVGKIAAFQEVYTWLLTTELEESGE